MSPKEAERCLVCGMKAETGRYTLEYHKLRHHFCSQQCLDMFSMHPHLYLGINSMQPAEVVKRRKIYLAEPLDAEMAEAITRRLREMMGIKEIQAHGSIIRIRYDLLQLTLSSIENVLHENDIQLDNSWFRRFRRSMIQSLEENELDNLARKPGSCCNRPPPGA